MNLQEAAELARRAQQEGCGSVEVHQQSPNEAEVEVSDRNFFNAQTVRSLAEYEKWKQQFLKDK